MIAARRHGADHAANDSNAELASPSRRRTERDLAIVALHQWGLSSRAISQLRLADVKHFPNGIVTVRLRVDDGILRGVRRPRYVRMDGAPANRVARHFESRAGVERSQPLFCGRRLGAPLSAQGVRKVVGGHMEILDRRERS